MDSGAVGPLLSIVIPTRNRGEYAKGSVEQVLGATSRDVEIVVQDNSDCADLESRLHGMDGASERVRYEYVSGELSFAENFERAVSRARGRFLCVIGDDDGVLSLIEPLALWAEANQVDSVGYRLTSVYYWPGAVSGDRAHLAGGLVSSPCQAHAIATQPLLALKELTKRGGIDYLGLPLTKIYHGIVSRELVARVVGKSGKLFGGLSPDIYSAVALSLEARRSVELTFPVTLPGVCASSGSADSASGRHTGSLRDAPHFRGNSDYAWLPEIPPIYSVESIWAESLQRALVDFGVPDRVNVPALVRSIRWRHRSLVGRVPRVGSSAGLASFVDLELRRQMRRVVARLSGSRRSRRVISGLENIGSATVALSALGEEYLPSQEKLALILSELARQNRWDR